MKKPNQKNQNIFQSVADRLSRIFGKEEVKEQEPTEPTASPSEQDVEAPDADKGPVAEVAKTAAPVKPTRVRRSRIRVRPTKPKSVGKEKNETEVAITPIYELSYDEMGPAIHDYILAHLADEKLNVDLMASQLKVSRTNLYTLVRQEFGVTPANLILDLRLKNAEVLLKEGLKVREVALKCGFVDPKYFSKVFKKYYGILPSNYGS